MRSLRGVRINFGGRALDGFRKSSLGYSEDDSLLNPRRELQAKKLKEIIE